MTGRGGENEPKRLPPDPSAGDSACPLVGGGEESANGHNVEGARGERRPCFPRRRSAYRDGPRGQHAAQGAHAGRCHTHARRGVRARAAKVHERLGQFRQSATVPVPMELRVKLPPVSHRKAMRTSSPPAGALLKTPDLREKVAESFGPS